MRALLDNLPFFHDDDAVAVFDRAEAVRDDDAGAAVHDFGERVLNLQLGFGVNVGGRFV